MLAGRHNRQVFLFLIAVLVPAVVLIGLATRIMNQDRELSAKRALDQRRAAVDQLRRELSARLEAIKLQEVNRLIRASQAGHPQESENPSRSRKWTRLFPILSQTQLSLRAFT